MDNQRKRERVCFSTFATAAFGKYKKNVYQLLRLAEMTKVHEKTQYKVYAKNPRRKFWLEKKERNEMQYSSVQRGGVFSLFLMATSATINKLSGALGKREVAK